MESQGIIFLFSQQVNFNMLGVNSHYFFKDKSFNAIIGQNNGTSKLHDLCVIITLESHHVGSIIILKLYNLYTVPVQII